MDRTKVLVEIRNLTIARLKIDLPNLADLYQDDQMSMLRMLAWDERKRRFNIQNGALGFTARATCRSFLL